MRWGAFRAVAALSVLLASAAPAVYGQSVWRPTLGAQLVSIGVTQPQVNAPGLVSFGPGLDYDFGARFTLPVGGRWSLGADANFVRSDGAWLEEYTFGPRFRMVGGRRWALFASAQPGWLHGNVCNCGFVTGIGPGASNLIVDLGGSLEVRLRRRWLWQAHAGDLVIRNPIGNFRANNVQFSTGLAFRF